MSKVHLCQLLTTTVVQIVPNSKLTLLPYEDQQYAVDMPQSTSYIIQHVHVSDYRETYTVINKTTQ